MTPTLIEMKPDRSLLNPEFDGYKLSLQNIATVKKDLTTSVDRILLDSTQYSLLHVKLYGLHNHLLGETINENDSVYFIDQNWNLCKTYVDPFNFDLIEPVVVWKVPRPRERQSGDYNVTFKFVSDALCVLTDGTGIVHVLNTGSRNDDDRFIALYSEAVTDVERGFLIQDAIYKQSDDKEELHILILYLEQLKDTERYTSIVNWVTLTNIEGKWGQTALREVQVKGDVQYLHLEDSCEGLYIISDNEGKFTINSEHPMKEDAVEEQKSYKWSQTVEDLTLKFPMPENFLKTKIEVVTNIDQISIKYDDQVLLEGKLHEAIDKDLTTWMVENNLLEVVINKVNVGAMWPTVVVDDDNGEHIVETCIVEESGLQHLTSETQENPVSGSTFNSQQIEDCDLDYDKTVSFQRLCGKTNRTIHRVNMGSNPVIVLANLKEGAPPAIGIRHDVDVLMWQPCRDNEDFLLKHEGTLHAFGYIQASKQQRKFTVCTPDLNNIAICQSSRYLFLYKQKQSITSGELRNRSSGRYIQNMAQQYVMNIPNDEVLGIYLSNKLLFLLAENFVTVYKIE